MKQTVFAVPMTCDSCVKDVSGALHQLKGINKVEVNLQDQLVSIEGTGMEFPMLASKPPPHLAFRPPCWRQDPL
jgi:copper chaperone for superoxide dismutase